MEEVRVDKRDVIVSRAKVTYLLEHLDGEVVEGERSSSRRVSLVFNTGDPCPWIDGVPVMSQTNSRLVFISLSFLHL